MYAVMIGHGHMSVEHARCSVSDDAEIVASSLRSRYPEYRVWVNPVDEAGA